MTSTCELFLREAWRALTADEAAPAGAAFTGQGDLPSVFAVSDLAAGSIGAAGLALAAFLQAGTGEAPMVRVDRRLAAFWFGTSLRPHGWALPPVWDPVAGDYASSDGFVRLHTNASPHRAAALRVLGMADGTADRAAVARAVAGWAAEDLERAVVEAGGCAAAMRGADAWRTHPQGTAVSAEPLVHRELFAAAAWKDVADPARPLAGWRVLDLTRVLAGPAATRFLAGWGAQVLRIDPPFWEEPSLEGEMTLGKRCARLDLRRAEDRATLERLMGAADILVHGYRADALERLGLGADRRRALNPGLVDVSLDAYGWTGPWHARRGFDSLVQMSCGIAEAGMRTFGRDRPTPLPVQALDHAAGYLMAAAALMGARERIISGAGSRWRTSLARVAALLMDGPAGDPAAPSPAPAVEADFDPAPEATSWGPARRLRPPLMVEGARMHWARPAGPLGRDQPRWQA